MSTSINYASTYSAGTTASGGALLNIGDASRTSPTSYGVIFTPYNGTSNAGGQVERIIYTPMGTTTAAIMRLFLAPAALTSFYPIGEIQLPSYTVSNTAAAGNGTVTGGSMYTLEAVDNPNLFPILVPSGWVLAASISATQLQQDIQWNTICQAQTTGSATYANMNGSSVTAASTTAVAAAAQPSGLTPMTLTSAPYVMPNTALLTITSAGNVSGVSFKIIGRSATGTILTETLAGPNATTVYSANAYASILEVIALGSSGTTASIGYSTVAGASILPVPAPIIITGGANISATNFTLVGAATNGLAQSETIAGPNQGYVQSTKNYASLFTVATSAGVATNFTVGTPPIMSGFYVIGMGGSA